MKIVITNQKQKLKLNILYDFPIIYSSHIYLVLKCMFKKNVRKKTFEYLTLNLIYPIIVVINLIKNNNKQIKKTETYFTIIL